MIKVENIEVFNLEGAIRGMRNPMNSWDRSDSYYGYDCKKCGVIDRDGFCKPQEHECSEYLGYEVGPNDLDLMKRLYKGGPVHAKYLRQIMVSMDITAPIYFNQEMDTYKVGTTRNSCSFQHKGVSKPFSIRDFSVDDERVYEVLDPIREKREHKLVYPYETDEYKILTVGDRIYRVYRNGKVISEPYEVAHVGDHRVRHFKEKELKPNQTNGGYWMLNLGGRRFLRKALLHRIVAEMWLPNDNPNLEVNHIDGNKGNNSVENLEWITHAENEKHAHVTGLKDFAQDLAWKYNGYKQARKVSFFDEQKIKELRANGRKETEIAEQFGISQGQVWAICNDYYDDDLHFLFEMCIHWERVINELNYLRDMYLETEDYAYFRAIRQLLPMGYNQRYTLTMSYQNVMNILDWRTDHKLTEWQTFCEIMRKELPYIKAIRGEE